MLTDWCVNNVDQVLVIFMNEIFLFVAKCSASPIDVYGGPVTRLHIPRGKVLRSAGDINRVESRAAT